MPRETRALPHIIRKTGADHRAIQIFNRRYVNPALVQRRAPAALGGKHLVANRIVNDSDLDPVTALNPDRNAETRITVGVICGAIERIDDPFPFAFPCFTDGSIRSA